MRGDEPKPSRFERVGWSDLEFPACAGMNRNRPLPAGAEGRVPRMRGDRFDNGGCVGIPKSSAMCRQTSDHQHGCIFDYSDRNRSAEGERLRLCNVEQTGGLTRSLLSRTTMGF